MLPTVEECERITTTTCQAEVNLTYAFGLDNPFPDCNELPSSISGSGKIHNVFHIPMFIKHSNLLKLLCFNVCIYLIYIAWK